MVGGVTSNTVTVNVQFTEPHEFVAVMMTFVTPTLNVCPEPVPLPLPLTRARL